MTLKVGMYYRVLQYYQIYSNDYPGLTYFMARLNLVPYVFVWEKGKTVDFSETIVVYDIKVGRCNQLNEYMNFYEYQRSRSFIDLGTRSLRFTWRGSSIGSMSAWHASGLEFDPHGRHILSWRLGHENIFTPILFLPLIQEEQL